MHAAVQPRTWSPRDYIRTPPRRRARSLMPGIMRPVKQASYLP